MANKTEQPQSGAGSDDLQPLLISKQLHKALSKRAALEGVTVDTLAASLLSRAVGALDAAIQVKPSHLDRPVKRQTAEMRVLNMTSKGVLVVKQPIKKGKKK
jgi:hypothetical protein